MQRHSNANLQLLWLDQSLQATLSGDMQRNYAQLREVISPIYTFGSEAKCLDFLSNHRTEKFCLLVSGSLGKNLVPQLHRFGQIESILVFCGDVNKHRPWTQRWSKIHAVHKDIQPICEALSRMVQQTAHHAIGFSMISSRLSDGRKSDDGDFNPAFIYTHILKEIFLSLRFSKHHQEQFVQFAREKYRGNAQDLEKLRQFEDSYDNSNPIHWYTRNGLLYPMVNQALREMDMLTLAHMGFFIQSLHQQIQTLHNRQFRQRTQPRPARVFRGQGVPREDFENLRRNANGFIWFNTFLSTSVKEEVAIDFARTALDKNDVVAVVYVMEIDPAMESVPFAQIDDISYFRDEKEILFSMHTCFRIERVEPIAEHAAMWRIHLRLTEQLDEKMQRNLEVLRQESSPGGEGWLRLAYFFMKFKEYRQAEAIYKMMLGEKISEAKRAHVFHNLALILIEMNDLEEALRHINEAIAIERRIGPKTSVDLMMLQNNRALIYQRQKDFTRALAEYENVLQRRRETLSPDDLNIAASYHSLGSIHLELKEFGKALNFFLQELDIFRKHRLDFTPDLDANYYNLGAVYFSLDDFSEAEKFAELCLKVRERLFPHDLISRAKVLKQLAEIAEKREKWDKAERFYQKALQILPAEHEDRAAICQRLGATAKRNRNYPQAIEFYREAMKIEQANSGKYHANLYEIYRELNSLFKKTDREDEAKAYADKAAKVRSRR